MSTKAYQERLITLVRDTITLLCKNGLEYSQEFAVEGLLGVTLDKGDVFLIPINELVNDKGVGTTDTGDDVLDTAELDDSGGRSPKHERKKKRRHHNHAESTATHDNSSLHYDTGNDWSTDLKQLDDDRISNTTDDQPSIKRQRNDYGIKSENQDDDDDDDVVVIKEEISDDQFVNAFQDSSLDNSTLNPNRTDHSDQGLGFFSQPGTSQMNFSMEQLAAGTGLAGAMGAMPPGVDGDQSWLQQTGDMDKSGSGQKHQCPVCQRCYSKGAKMKRHMSAVHYKVRHECNLCNKSYTQPDNLATHKRQIHNIIPINIGTHTMGMATLGHTLGHNLVLPLPDVDHPVDRLGRPDLSVEENGQT